MTTYQEIVSSLKESAAGFIQGGETYRDTLDHNLRQIALNDFMDELFDLAEEDSDQREQLTNDVVQEAMDYADELLEALDEDEDDE